MMLRNTIIILVGCNQLGYGMEIEEPPLFRPHEEMPPKQSSRKPQRLKPEQEPIPRGGARGGEHGRPSGKPGSGTGTYHQPPIVISPLPGRGRPGAVESHVPKNRESSSLSENQDVSTYLEQRKSNLTRLITLFDGVSLDTIAHAQARYLENMQKFYDQGKLTQMPSSLAGGFSLKATDKTSSSLLPWMIFLTDSFSFAEQLSQLPSATQLEKKQFQLSPHERAFCDEAQTSLITVSQQFLSAVQALVSRYPDLFSGAVQQGNYSPEKLEMLTTSMQQIEGLLQTVFDQRDTYISSLMEHSPESQEALLLQVIDQNPALSAWKQQQQFESKKPLLVFPSYKSFMRDFSYFNVKGSVEKYVGQGPEKFATVQDLVAALDQISFILESKNFWISFFQGYSRQAVKKVIKAIIEAYPGTYVPSKRFIINYCTLRRIFKPVSFFIPNIGRFLADAQNLTIEELAKKYGQGSEQLQSLLDNVYGAVYVLQQTNQTGQVAQLMALERKITTLYPDLSPTVVSQMVARKNLPLKLVFDSQSGLIEMLATTQKELFSAKQQGITKSLLGLSTALDAAAIELNVQEAQRLIGPSEGVRLNKSLQSVLKELDIVESVLGQQVSADLLGSVNGAAFETQLSSLKRNAMKIGLDAAYEQAKEQQDKLGDQLIHVVRDITTSYFLTPKLPPLWGTFFMEQQAALNSLDSWMSGSAADLKDEVNPKDVNSLVVQIAAKSALEKENESDFQACIWASNKMGIMESKVKCMESLIKIKTTPLFITGYKAALKDLKADLEFLYSSRRVQKCLNVIARRAFLSQEIHSLESQIEQAEKNQDEKNGTNQPSNQEVIRKESV